MKREREREWAIECKEWIAFWANLGLSIQNLIKILMICILMPKPFPYISDIMRNSSYANYDNIIKFILFILSK